MPDDPAECVEDPPICFRCGAEQPTNDSWEDNHHDGEVFCDKCFHDRDRYGYPFMTDHDEMNSNPNNYLPRDY